MVVLPPDWVNFPDEFLFKLSIESVPSVTSILPFKESPESRLTSPPAIESWPLRLIFTVAAESI